MRNNRKFQERLGTLRTVMNGYVESGKIPGIVTLVSRRGELVVDAFGKQSIGSGSMRRDSIFRISSMTKPIVAAAAMILVEECKLRLNDRIDDLLPELADRKVLRRIDSPLGDTVPANRPITLRDLLTFKLGIGIVMAPPGLYPIQVALDEAGLTPGPNPLQISPDEYMSRLGRLPLIHQPGEKWMYHLGSDILGILIARASGQSLEQFLHKRLFEPLGMKDTGFHVPAEKLNRFTSSYMAGKETGELAVHDEASVSRWAEPPLFPSGGGGLVSTAEDYLAFCQMMLDKGVHNGERILSRRSIELMITDHLTPEQKADARIFFGEHSGWGFGLAVNTRRVDLATVPGRFGWDGGIGTTAYTDPLKGVIGILMTQRLMESPEPPGVFLDFWTSVYQSIDDSNFEAY